MVLFMQFLKWQRRKHFAQQRRNAWISLLGFIFFGGQRYIQKKCHYSPGGRGVWNHSVSVNAIDQCIWKRDASDHCLEYSHRVAVFFCEMIFVRSFADASCFANGIVKFCMEKKNPLHYHTVGSCLCRLPHISKPKQTTDWQTDRLTADEISLEWLLLFLSCFNVEWFIDFQVKGNICILVFLFVCCPCQ